MLSTTFYRDNTLEHREKLITLREFIELGKLRVGQQLYLVRVDSRQEEITDPIFICIGDATPFHQPSDNDAGVGWDNNFEHMNKFVIEVHDNPMVCFELPGEV